MPVQVVIRLKGFNENKPIKKFKNLSINIRKGDLMCPWITSEVTLLLIKFFYLQFNNVGIYRNFYQGKDFVKIPE